MSQSIARLLQIGRSLSQSSVRNEDESLEISDSSQKTADFNPITPEKLKSIPSDTEPDEEDEVSPRREEESLHPAGAPGAPKKKLDMSGGERVDPVPDLTCREIFGEPKGEDHVETSPEDTPKKKMRYTAIREVYRARETESDMDMDEFELFRHWKYDREDISYFLEHCRKFNPNPPCVCIGSDLIGICESAIQPVLQREEMENANIKHDGGIPQGYFGFFGFEKIDVFFPVAIVHQNPEQIITDINSKIKDERAKVKAVWLFQTPDPFDLLDLIQNVTEDDMIYSQVYGFAQIILTRGSTLQALVSYLSFKTELLEMHVMARDPDLPVNPEAVEKFYQVFRAKTKRFTRDPVSKLEKIKQELMDEKAEQEKIDTWKNVLVSLINGMNSANRFAQEEERVAKMSAELKKTKDEAARLGLVHDKDWSPAVGRIGKRCKKSPSSTLMDFARTQSTEAMMEETDEKDTEEDDVEVCHTAACMKEAGKQKLSEAFLSISSAFSKLAKHVEDRIDDTIILGAA